MSNQLTESCFENIIGITPIDCDCIEGNRPDDYNVSQSGLFIDGLLPMNYAEALASCRNSDVWDITKNAIAEAVIALKADLFSCVKLNTRLKKPYFKGTITDSTLESIKTVSYGGKARAGMTMLLGNFRGAKMKINRIGLKFNGTTTLDITISDNLTGDIYTIQGLETQANMLRWNVLGTPIEIDFQNEFTFPKQLWLHYDTANGVLPCETKFSCNCGGSFRPSWNADIPQFMSAKIIDQYSWANYLMAAGTLGTDESDKNGWSLNQKQSYGIVLDVTLTCDMEASLCSEEMDFTTDPVYIAMAHALRYKACAIIIDKVLKSGKPDRYTTVAGAQLMNDKTLYESEYANRIVNFLCHEISEEIDRYSDCFKCKDAWDLKKRTILK